MSFRPMVQVQGEFCGNALRFATHDEALRSASGLMDRWTLVTDIRVDESSDPVNYRLDDNGTLVDVAKEPDPEPPEPEERDYNPDDKWDF